MTDTTPAVIGTPATPNTDVLRQVREGITGLSDAAKELAEAGDWESLIKGLAPLQDILSDLRLLESEVKRHIADTMPEFRVSVEGVGTVERRKSITRRNWDSHELLRKVVMQALVDPVTGEIPNSAIEAVDQVMQSVQACLPITKSTGWRVNALRDRGFDPDEWCEQNLNGYTIQFNRRKSD
jgi:hypothetical protein